MKQDNFHWGKLLRKMGGSSDGKEVCVEEKIKTCPEWKKASKET